MIKKVLTYTLVVTTMVWSVGLLATPLSVSAAVSGDLVKKAGSPAVYYLGSDTKLHVFTSADVYWTWYSSFAGIQTISDAEFNSYGFGTNVWPRPGVKLVQAVDGETPWNIVDPKVYAVDANGEVRHITSATVAAELFGANWETKIIPVVISVFTQYNSILGNEIDSAADFDPAAAQDAAPTINDNQNFSGTSGGVSTGTSLTVALAPDTPATGFVIANTIHNKFTKVNFTASADGDLVIDQLTVRRGGTVAQDGAFSGIALLDGTTLTRTEDAKTLNSEHMAVFNKDITIPAGTTKSYYIAGNMASSLASYAGQIPSLDLYSVTLAGGKLDGSLPIVGNHQVLDGTITPGTLTLANGSDNPTASTQKIGATDYVVSGIKLSANGTEDFKVSRLTWDQGGTASDSDVSSLDLLIDQSVAATISGPASDKVSFDFGANPILIEKGKSKDFALRLNIDDGSARTIRFDIQDETDVQATGQLYGATVKVAAGSGATVDAEPFWTAPVTTVAEGSLRIGPSTLVSANIPEDSDQVTLGKFEFEAKGEPIVITRMGIFFDVTTSTTRLVAADDLTNVSVYDENGKVVAGPLDPTLNADPLAATSIARLSATTTDTITVGNGLHVYTVKGDLDTDWATDDTIVTSIHPNFLTAKGDTSGITVTPTPASKQSSATMTVKTANLDVSVSTSPPAQSVVAGANNYTFANLILDAANSGEDVRITQIKAAISTATANPAQTSNWSIFDGTSKLSVTNDPDSDTSTKTTAGNSATATFTFSTPLVITKGTTKTLTIKGNITSSATSGTVSVGLPDSVGADHITAKGNNSGTDAGVTISVSNGQIQTIQTTGTLTFSQDSSTPDASMYAGKSTGQTLAVLNVFGLYEDINVEKIYFTGSQVNSGGWDQIQQLYLYKGGTLIGQATPTSTDAANRTVLIDMTGNPLVIEKSTSVLLSVKGDMANANYETPDPVIKNGTSWQGIQVAINAAGDVTAKGTNSGNTLTSSQLTVTGANGNNIHLVRSILTITPDSQLSDGVKSTTLGSGTISDVSLYKIKATANSAGDVAIGAVSFLETKSSATSSALALWEGTTKVGTATTTQISGTDASAATYLHTVVLTTNGAVADAQTTASPNSTNILPTNAVIPAGSSKTYVLKGTTACTSANSCSGSSGSGTLQFQLLGDSSQVGSTPTSTRTVTAQIMNTSSAVYEVSLLWTDFWRTPILGRASTSATTTEQWLNGFLVKDSTGEDLQATSTASTISR